MVGAGVSVSLSASVELGRGCKRLSHSLPSLQWWQVSLSSTPGLCEVYSSSAAVTYEPCVGLFVPFVGVGSLLFQHFSSGLWFWV